MMRSCPTKTNEKRSLTLSAETHNGVERSEIPLQPLQRRSATADLAWRHLMGGMVEQPRIHGHAFRFGFA